MSADATKTEGFALGPDGTAIYYRVAGNGPAIVLCDGILCEGFVWRYLRPVLAASHRVVHWNYRAHGRSGLPRDPARIDIVDHVEDLVAVLDALGIPNAIIAGHSMGTQVCLELYRRHPERVRAMLLLCGSYGRITRTFQGSDVLYRLLPLLLEQRRRYPRLARALWAMTPARLAWRLAKLTRQVDPERTRADDMIPYFEHLGEMEPEYFLRMVQAAGEHSAEDMLPTVRVPTLVIAAERDSFTPSRLAEQMARQIPNARYLMIDGGTHAAPIEQPAAVNAAVTQFLETCG